MNNTPIEITEHQKFPSDRTIFAFFGLTILTLGVSLFATNRAMENNIASIEAARRINTTPTTTTETKKIPSEYCPERSRPGLVCFKDTETGKYVYLKETF